MSAPAVEARGVARWFGRIVALDGADLRVEVGERVALLGANGAGKTTLLRVLATLLRPSAGQTLLFGLDPWGGHAHVRRRIGFLGHRPWLYDQLTARENLAFYARLYGLPDPVPRAERWLREVGLWRQRHERAARLSHGQQQRLGLARALLHDPDLLLLDEPDTGLDAAGRDLLGGLLRAHPGAVIMSSHQHDLARRWCARWVTLERGRCVADDGGTLARAEVPGVQPIGAG